tara:strand:+ start:1077 stop:1292 length:216 start_codon:yes stop_codon:yes gene_type:complete
MPFPRDPKDVIPDDDGLNPDVQEGIAPVAITNVNWDQIAHDIFNHLEFWDESSKNIEISEAAKKKRTASRK